jgi:hypothetical protein
MVAARSTPFFDISPTFDPRRKAAVEMRQPNIMNKKLNAGILSLLKFEVVEFITMHVFVFA